MREAIYIREFTHNISLEYYHDGSLEREVREKRSFELFLYTSE